MLAVPLRSRGTKPAMTSRFALTCIYIDVAQNQAAKAQVPESQVSVQTGILQRTSHGKARHISGVDRKLPKAVASVKV
jgi:hypothetical protein